MADTELREDSARAPADGPRTAALLRFMCSTTAGTEIEIGPRGLTIGRASEPSALDVEVADPVMSSRHARIALTGGEWTFHDLGSRNGSFVAGVPLPPGGSLALEHDAVIRLGDTLAVCQGSAALIHRSSAELIHLAAGSRIGVRPPREFGRRRLAPVRQN